MNKSSLELFNKYDDCRFVINIYIVTTIANVVSKALALCVCNRHCFKFANSKNKQNVQALSRLVETLNLA